MAVEPSPTVRRLRFVPSVDAVDALASATQDAAPGTTTVVLDTLWDPSADQAAAGIIGLRGVVERALAGHDLYAEAAERLDTWAETSGIVTALTLEGVSFWYGVRLGYWLWLIDRMLWMYAVDDLLRAHPGIAVITCASGTDTGLVEAARDLAQRDGIELVDETATGATSEPGGAADVGVASPETVPLTIDRPTAVARPRRSLVQRLRSRVLPTEPERRRRFVRRRLQALERDAGHRLLVVQLHVRQRIDTPTGPRLINPFIGPIIDRLRGTRLEPMEVDVRSELADDTVWERLRSPGSERTVPFDALAMNGPVISRADARHRAGPLAEAIARITTPLEVAGVNVGPAIAAVAGRRSVRVLTDSIREVDRIRRLLRRLRPVGILIADEYHRQDWLAAAGAEGIPVVAVQHGVIHPWHLGYVHRSRPPQLRLPKRTYVFGPWERDLLVGRSVYRPDEVVVSGSPRLDLVAPTAPDRDGVRAELGIRTEDRLVVLSGTWGPMDRRFAYPINLVHLFDRPIPGIHVVVKQHPTERDAGPYARIFELAGAATGHPPPPLTIVQSIDLYRLLAAADAHVGIHSTVLTEAVVAGTPNLLAAGLRSSDLLGYVAAGVAVPVRDGGDMLEALARSADDLLPPDAREAFVRAHFEPGIASQRIADDLLDWMGVPAADTPQV